MRLNLVVSFVIFLITLMVVELGLRMMGWQPGQFQYSPWVNQVDSLYELEGFHADQEGVFKVDTSVSNFLSNAILENRFEIEDIGLFCAENNLVPEISAVYSDNLNSDSFDTELYAEVNRVRESTDLTFCDSSLMSYWKNPINSDGFYSIEFNSCSYDKPRILLLGDSFTWGHSASIKTKSFANNLLARGYQIYNTGISGADLPQYLNVLRNYAPRLKPDVVVVNVFLGNDIMYHERIPRSHIPIHYSTNAGNLLSFQGDTLFITSKQAYSNVMSNMIVPTGTTVRSISAKTVVSTLAWAFLAKHNLIENKLYRYPNQPVVPESRNTLTKIIGTCEEMNVPLIISVIPELRKDAIIGAEGWESVFDGIDYFEPEMTVNQYSYSDGHFNDEGHKVYADYLEELIKSKLSKEKNSR